MSNTVMKFLTSGSLQPIAKSSFLNSSASSLDLSLRVWSSLLTTLVMSTDPCRNSGECLMISSSSHAWRVIGSKTWARMVYPPFSSWGLPSSASGLVASNLYGAGGMPPQMAPLIAPPPQMAPRATGILGGRFIPKLAIIGGLGIPWGNPAAFCILKGICIGKP